MQVPERVCELREERAGVTLSLYIVGPFLPPEDREGPREGRAKIECERGVRRCVLGCVPNVAAQSQCGLGTGTHTLVLKVPDCEYGRGISSPEQVLTSLSH
jgi:hypothetical protein